MMVTPLQPIKNGLIGKKTCDTQRLTKRHHIVIQQFPIVWAQHDLHNWQSLAGRYPAATLHKRNRGEHSLHVCTSCLQSNKLSPDGRFHRWLANLNRHHCAALTQHNHFRAALKVWRSHGCERSIVMVQTSIFCQNLASFRLFDLLEIITINHPRRRHVST